MMNSPFSFRSPALALSLATLFWSGNFVAGRALHEVIDPVSLNFLRWSLALVLLAPFLGLAARASLPALRREWRLILALGASGIAAFHTLLYLALQSTTATNALLVLSLAPILTLIGAVITGAGRFTGLQTAGALVSMAGAGILITRGDLAGTLAHGFTAGDLWMLLAVVVWAVYSLLLRRRPADLSPSVTLVASVVAALVLMLPLYYLFAPTPLASLGSANVLLSIGYIALFSSVFAFLLWSRGVAALGPARAGQFVHLMPVFGPVLAFVLLGESPTAAQMAGAVLVLGGIALVERRATALLPTGSKPA